MLAGPLVYHMGFSIVEGTSASEPVESWSFNGPRVTNIAFTENNLFMKDEAGDYWRIALHVARRRNILIKQMVVPPESQNDWLWSSLCRMEKCWNLRLPERQE